jgi:hypothetical protein
MLLLVSPINALLEDSPKWNIVHEGSHDCIREWWNVDVCFETDRAYHLTASFEYEKETPAANLFFTLFDCTTGAVYELGSFEDPLSSFDYACRFGVNLSYNASWLRGCYPRYDVHLYQKNVVFEATLEAVSRPVFVMENAGGVLPLGFGSYRYSFIPKCTATGTLAINGTTQPFTGVAYYEHVWGNWSYHNPFKRASARPYADVAAWWWHNKNISFDRFALSSSNPFGYDWAWAAFDNGWALFYGAVPFWLEEIPLGVVYLYDGRKVRELGNLSYEYREGVFYHGFHVPTCITLTASDAGTLSLTLHMRHTPHIYEDVLDSRYWKGLLLYENPGVANGTYISSSGRIENLTGRAEIEIERQISIFEYVSARLSRTTSGIEFVFLSCLLNVILEVCLLPYAPFLQFSFSRIG